MDVFTHSEEKRFQWWDGVRALFLSSVGPFRDSIAMLVLIHVYAASDLQKTTLSLLLQSGLFLSIPLLAAVRHFQFSISSVLSAVYVLAALLCVSLWYFDSVWLFICLGGAVLIVCVAVHPLLISLYARYGGEHRGRRTATSFLCGTAGAMVFGAAFGEVLDSSIAHYRFVLLATGASLLLSALAAQKLPHIRLSAEQASSRFGFSSMRLLKTDRLFRVIIIAWFFLGFSNHWLLMYRTNYFVESRFGFSYSANDAMLLVVVLPSLFEVLSYYFFGRLFDGMNFVRLRLVLNLVHASYLALVFLGPNWYFHIAGVVCYGLHRGGGKVVWNLWVTRIAEPEQVPEYMAVHGFFTGVRMVLGPAVGLYSLAYLGPAQCTYLALLLVVVSSMMFLSIASHPRVLREA